MNEKQSQEAFDLSERLYTEVHDLIDKVMTGVDPEVEDEVRQRMTETFRFWKR